MADRDSSLFLKAPAHRQRGQALLVLLMILVIAGSAVFYSFAGSANSAIERDKITAAALAQAKEALIGYAAADDNRPGSLPCPDTGNTGSAPLFAGAECPSYIGRLPWRTLGLPDLRDGNGERLWYAVTREFARNPSCGSSCPLNSDTKGTLVITGTAPAADVIAIVFSPGQALSPQYRSPAGENAVVNYLEGGNETGITTSNFVTGSTTPAFNDRALPLSGADVMTPVERRAAKEILTILQAYRTSGANWCNCYPYADVSNGQSDANLMYGRVPLDNAQPPSSTATPDWDDLGINMSTYPALAWLRTNQWRWVFFYAVAPRESESNSLVSDCFWVNTGYLRLDGTCATRVSIVLITTGPAGANRPVTSWNNSDWNKYIDDSENNNGDTTFITPSSTAYARDRLYTL